MPIALRWRFPDEWAPRSFVRPNRHERAPHDRRSRGGRPMSTVSESRSERPDTLPSDDAPQLRAARADDLGAIERLLHATNLPTVGVAEILGSHPDDFIVADDPAHP